MRDVKENIKGLGTDKPPRVQKHGLQRNFRLRWDWEGHKGASNRGVRDRYRHQEEQSSRLASFDCISTLGIW